MWGAVAIFILKYLWFIVIPLGLLSITLFKMRKASVLSDKGISSVEANAAYRTIAATIVVIAGGIGLAQLTGGIDNPFFLYSGNLNNHYVVAGKVVLGVFWIGLVAWAWGSKQFITYAKLVLPRKMSALLPVAKPLVSLVAVIGISLLIFYQGNRVPFAIFNLSHQPIEWVAIIHQGNSYRINEIPQHRTLIRDVPLDGSGTFKVQYKLKNDSNTWQGTIPFTISEFSMGFVQLMFYKDGKLGISDHRLLH